VIQIDIEMIRSLPDCGFPLLIERGLTRNLLQAHESVRRTRLGVDAPSTLRPLFFRKDSSTALNADQSRAELRFEVRSDRLR